MTGFEQAQTLDEQSQYAKEMDLIFAQEHWGIGAGRLYPAQRIHVQ